MNIFWFSIFCKVNKEKRMHTVHFRTLTIERFSHSGQHLPPGSISSSLSHWTAAIYSTSLLLYFLIPKLLTWSWRLTAHHAPPQACAHHESKLCSWSCFCCADCSFHMLHKSSGVVQHSQIWQQLSCSARSPWAQTSDITAYALENNPSWAERRTFE